MSPSLYSAFCCVALKALPHCIPLGNKMVAEAPALSFLEVSSPMEKNKSTSLIA